MLKKFVFATVAAVMVGLVLGCGGSGGLYLNGSDCGSTIYSCLDPSFLAEGGELNNCGKDGTANSCKTVKIGSQTWMAENLNREIGNSWCYGVSKKDSICAKFGRLYDWKTAIKACPAGWHLPTLAEWDTLVLVHAGRLDSASLVVAGNKMKTAKGWYNNGNGTDDFGFSALPGGGRDVSGSFFNVGKYGFWWTATDEKLGIYSIENSIKNRKFEEVDAISAYLRIMAYDGGAVYGDKQAVEEGFSVRCVQD
jgi:uncharacterized protein (TIGR02145 family)